MVTFILVGCGGSSDPEDVAKEFVVAKSEGNIGDMKELSIKGTVNFEELFSNCNKDAVKQLAKELKEKKHEIDKKRKDKNYKDINEKYDLKVKSFTNKYDQQLKMYKRKGDIFAMMELEEKVKKEIKPIFVEFIQEVDKNIDKETAESIVAIQFGKSAYEEAMRIISNKNIDNIDPQCSQKYFRLKKIDKVTLIESKGDAKDKKQVKLEVVFDDGSSKKIWSKLENIQGKWKVIQ